MERFLELLLAKFTCAEDGFCAAFATMAKIRWVLDFGTPRREARFVADSAGTEIVRAFDIGVSKS